MPQARKAVRTPGVKSPARSSSHAVDAAVDGASAAEFNGSTRLLCDKVNIPQLCNLTRLNLYQCGLNRLTGIGNLRECPLEALCLGRNELSSIPDEVRP